MSDTKHYLFSKFYDLYVEFKLTLKMDTVDSNKFVQIKLLLIINECISGILA